MILSRKLSELHELVLACTFGQNYRPHIVLFNSNLDISIQSFIHHPVSRA